MNKLHSIINAMGYNELKAIEHDLYQGNIGSLIKKRIDEYDALSVKICPTCGAKVTDEAFSLIWGAKDFRKKANFCAVDCLQFFINRFNKQSVKQEVQKE